MFDTLIKGLGGLTRDLVELGDSTIEVTKKAVVDVADGVASIPDLLAEGYSEGVISNGDNQPEPEQGEGFLKPEED